MLGKTQRGRCWLTLPLLVLLGLAAAILLRKDIAAWALTSALEVRGLEVGALNVTQLGWRRASVRGLALKGPGVAVELEAIDLDYRPLDLLSGGLPAVSLAKGELALDHQSPWLKDQLQTGQSTPAPEASSSENPSSQILPALPDVTVTDILLRLTTPAGPLDVGVSGNLRQAPDRALSGAFRLNAKSAQGESVAVIDFTLEPDHSLAAELRLEEGGFDVGELSLKGVTGRASIAFDAARRKLEAFEAQLQLAQVRGAVSPSVALAPLSVALDAGLEQEDVVFDLAVKTDRSQEQPAQAEIRGRISPGAEGLSLGVSSRIDSPADLPFFSQFLVPLPHAGFLTGRAEVRALLPSAAKLQATEVWALPPARWLQMVQTMETEFSLQTEHLSHRDYVEGLTSALAGRVLLDDAGLELRLAEPATAELAALSGVLLGRLTLPADLQEWMAGPLALSLAPGREETLLSAARGDVLTGPYAVAAALKLSGANFSLLAGPAGEVHPVQNRWTLTGPLSLQAGKLPLRGITGARGLFDLDLAGVLVSDAAGTNVAGDLELAADEVVKDDVSLTGLRASIPLRGEVSAQALHFQTTAPATATLSGLSWATGQSTDALKLDIPQMDVTLDFATGRPRPSLTARLAPAAFALLAEGEPLPLVTEAVALELSPTEENGGLFLLQLDSKGVSLPAQQLRAANIAVNVAADLENGVGRGRFEDLTIEDRAEIPRFEPVILKGNFRRDAAGRLDFAAQGHSFQESVTFDVKGDSRPGRDPRIEVTLPPHDFAVTPLKLNKLSWISDALVDRGGLSGKLQVEVSQGGPVGVAEFFGDGLGGKLLGFPFSGLSLAMDLDGLWPPETARPIRVSLAELDPGLAIRDLQLQVSLPPAEAFTLDLPAAAFTLLGARISLEGGRLALLEGKADLPIRITGLDLAEVLKAADFEDIDVTGRLSGDMPVSFGDGRVTLRSSKLAATEPGVLRVRSDEVASLLTGYGDEVNSMLRALEDFYYDDLSLTLAKTADDDLTLLLSILGQNPSVLEGQPFRINLNLESNIGQILNTLGEGLEISKDLLSGRYSLQ